MATESQAHAEASLVPRDKQDLESIEQADVDSASPSATNTDTQPPRASLLGLPKELLNYIITLAVVDDPDADKSALLSKQLTESEAGPLHEARSLRSPALARSCTELDAIVLPMYYAQNTFAFCSASVAHAWLHRERRKQSDAPVRRIRIYFDPGLFCTIAYASLEFSLEEKTRKLAIPVESAYCRDMCSACQNALASKMEDINGRDGDYDYGEKRLAAVADELSRSPVRCGFAEGGTRCDGWF
jgi:hypothetical protein